jgi:shikimate kinase
MKNLILFGFKGAGKTHFGKKLSTILHCPFIDTDFLIQELHLKETNQKLSIKEIYRLLGETAFRALEKKTIPILQSIDHSVIALGGGFVLDPDNIEKLQTLGPLVYLKASPAKLQKRIFQDELPAIVDSVEAFHKMIHEREPIYRAIPARKIDTDLLDEEGVIAELKAIWLLE